MGHNAGEWWRRIWRVGLVASVLCAVPATVALPVPPVAATGKQGSALSSYTAPSINSPRSIAEGSDGALWFTNLGPAMGQETGTIGRISTAGVVSSYTDPIIQSPESITAGSDGALWFTNLDNDSIGRITTAGVVSHYRDPRLGGLAHITAGPDGALWFTDGSSIGRMTTAGNFSFYAVAGGAPQMITAGPDGALWFTNSTGTAGGWVGRISTAGVITRYDDPSIMRPGGITTGPDGALWFANSASFSFPGSIGRITTAGVVTNYSSGCKHTNVEACSGTSGPGAITAGPDGALWFTSDINGFESIGRITTAGVVSSFTDPSVLTPLSSITAGPDSALWFTNPQGAGTGSIGRIATTASIRVGPHIGGPGTLVNVKGGGYQPGEQVAAVKYRRHQFISHGTYSVICSATVAANGTFHCAGRIPTGTDAGEVGPHDILATGHSSRFKARTTFTLT